MFGIAPGFLPSHCHIGSTRQYPLPHRIFFPVEQEGRTRGHGRVRLRRAHPRPGVATTMARGEGRSAASAGRGGAGRALLAAGASQKGRDWPGAARGGASTSECEEGRRGQGSDGRVLPRRRATAERGHSQGRAARWPGKAERGRGGRSR